MLRISPRSFLAWFWDLLFFTFLDIFWDPCFPQCFFDLALAWGRGGGLTRQATQGKNVLHGWGEEGPDPMQDILHDSQLKQPLFTRREGEARGWRGAQGLRWGVTE